MFFFLDFLSVLHLRTAIIVFNFVSYYVEYCSENVDIHINVEHYNNMYFN